MTHDDIGTAVIKFLDPAIWATLPEATLGPASHDGGRADVLAIKKAYRTEFRIYECKASRSDLLADTKHLKFEKYYPYCNRLYFAIAKGIEWKDLLQHHPVGILEVSDAGVKIKRHAPYRDRTGPGVAESYFLSILFSRLGPNNRRLLRLEAERAQLLRAEIGERAYLLNAKIQNQRIELSEREEQCARLEATAEKSVIRKIKTALGMRASWHEPEEFKPGNFIRDYISEKVITNYRNDVLSAMNALEVWCQSKEVAAE